MSSELTAKVNKERAIMVLIPMLILHLVLLSVQIESSSGTLLFKTWTLTLQAPIIGLSSGIKNGVSRAWRNYVWTMGARAENERLQNTVRQLMILNNAYEQSMQETVRLRRLLSLNETLPYKSIGARVVARTPSFLSNLIYIDRGSDDGVRVDAAVLSVDGIVGRTLIVTKHQSQVQLITNPDASIGALVERTRTPGVLKGSGDMFLDLNYVDNTVQVNVGDIVLSSGLDGIYPKGLPIGKVVDSRKGKGVFRTIKVEPKMDFIRLEEVSVLLNELKDEKGAAGQ